MFMSTS